MTHSPPPRIGMCPTAWAPFPVWVPSQTPTRHSRHNVNWMAVVSRWSDAASTNTAQELQLQVAATAAGRHSTVAWLEADQYPGWVVSALSGTVARGNTLWMESMGACSAHSEVGDAGWNLCFTCRLGRTQPHALNRQWELEVKLFIFMILTCDFFCTLNIKLEGVSETRSLSRDITLSTLH